MDASHVAHRWILVNFNGFGFFDEFSGSRDASDFGLKTAWIRP